MSGYPSNEHDDIVLSTELECLMERAYSYLKSGFPLHFTGPTGVGKTKLAFFLAKKINRPIIHFQGNPEVVNADFLGGISGFHNKKIIDNYIHSVYKLEEKMEKSFIEGPLLKAVNNGYTFIYDDFTRTKPETNNLFLSLLQEGTLPLYGLISERTHLSAHPDFSIIFTSNPEDYTGNFKSRDALLDRMFNIPLDYLDSETERQILMEKTGLTSEEATTITAMASFIRKKCQQKGAEPPSIRAFIMLAKIASEQKIPIDIDNVQYQLLVSDILLSLLYKHVHSFEELYDILTEKE
jgi:gas vesicle protein GvpN